MGKPDTMPTMTTAEFAKAQLSALPGPVEVRRYRTVIGVYYPSAFITSSITRVAELEAEVKALRKRLAADPLDELEADADLLRAKRK